MRVLIGPQEISRVWFSPMDSCEEGHISQAGEFRPFRHSLTGPINSDVVIPAHISGLLLRRGPSAIVGGIWSIAVLAIKGMVGWLWSHSIGEELVIHKDRINSYRNGSLASVKCPILKRGIGAAAYHRFPRIIERTFKGKGSATVLRALFAFYVVISIFAGYQVIAAYFMAIAAMCAWSFESFHGSSLTRKVG